MHGLFLALKEPKMTKWQQNFPLENTFVYMQRIVYENM